MIPGLMVSPAQPAQGAMPAAAAAGAHDKGFSSILKSSVQKTDDAPDNEAPAPAPGETSSQNTITVSNKPGLKSVKSEPVRDAAASDAEVAPVEKDTSQDTNLSDMTNNMLMQLVLQMRASDQQVINNPAGKEVPAEAPGLLVAQVAQSLQAKNDDKAGQVSPLLQNEEAPAASNETDNAAPFLNKLSDEASNIPAKAAEKLKSAVMNPEFKDNSLNQATGDTAKAESTLNALDQASKNAAFALKSAGTQSSDNDNLAQWKMDISTAQTSIHGSEDKNSPMDVKNLSSVYAQVAQTQASSAHSASPVQESVPLSRLSTMDEIISKAVDAGQKNLIIRIDPPDLGSVQIKLSFDNGVLKADVRVDSSAVKDSFNLALPQIKTSLENSGIKISEFNVDVREDQYKNEQQRNNQGQQQQRQSRESKSGFFDFFA